MLTNLAQNFTGNITNISVIKGCTIKYITVSADPRLMIAILLLIIVLFAIITLFELKLREKYAKHKQRLLSQLQDTDAKDES